MTAPNARERAIRRPPCLDLTLHHCFWPSQVWAPLLVVVVALRRLALATVGRDQKEVVDHSYYTSHRATWVVFGLLLTAAE